METRAEVDGLLNDPEIDDEASLPLWLRPLAWMNAPLSGCSPALRQTVGYVAIMTLTFAAAVIAYVALVRKH